MHRLPTCQSQRPNVNGYTSCEVSYLSKPPPQGKWPWLMHRLPTCQNQRPNVNGCEWCTHFFQKLHMNCARARISWFGPKKIWRYDLLDSLAPAMNPFKKWCPWCDFSVVMWLEFFVAPATRDVTAAPWCELSRALVSVNTSNDYSWWSKFPRIQRLGLMQSWGYFVAENGLSVGVWAPANLGKLNLMWNTEPIGFA